MPFQQSLWAKYKLRLRRKRLLWRAFRKRNELQRVSRKTDTIKPKDVLLFATVRNEELRLPYFLQHYRRLGVRHFLIVDNASDDGTADLLRDAEDVSLWSTSAGYKASRFGMDWLTCLQWRYGHGHWVLTVDADELLIYPDWETRGLDTLTAFLETENLRSFGAVMLDLYPKGSVEDQSYLAGQNPAEVVSWFDAYGYWAQLQPRMSNLWLQGGVRARCFFGHDPSLSPTLNKVPLVRWDRSYVYVNSTHNALPVALNRTYDVDGYEKPTGVLLHSKFLPDASRRAAIEQQRGEHFSDAQHYQDYYTTVSENPDLWCENSVRLEGWQQLEELGLMFRGRWGAD